MKFVYCFSYFITCGKTWNTILNKYKQWHFFLFFFIILFDFNKNSMFLISMFLCFALVPRTVDFHWYRYRILKFWYRDNTNSYWCFVLMFRMIKQGRLHQRRRPLVKPVRSLFWMGWVTCGTSSSTRTNTTWTASCTHLNEPRSTCTTKPEMTWRHLIGQRRDVRKHCSYRP